MSNRAFSYRPIFAGSSLRGLSACEVHYTDLSAQQQTPSFKVYPRPANGYFLCLSSVPGTPTHANAPGGTIVGQTGDVVAFAGFQNGDWVSIQLCGG